MWRNNRWTMVVLLIVGGLQLSACRSTPVATASKSEPAKVERIEGTNINRVRLEARAAERLGIQTALVRDAEVAPRPSDAGQTSSTQGKVIPYSAVVYDPKGDTWTFTNPEPLVFVREPIRVSYVEKDEAVLLDGPASGTPVVTVGAAELFGIDYGLGK